MLEPVVFRDRKQVARILLGAFIFPWIFDTKSSAGYEWLIYPQLASFLFSTAVFIAALRIFRTRVRLGFMAGNGVSITVAVIFVTVAMFSGLYEHNDTFLIISQSLPTVLFIFALVMVSLIARAGLEPEDVIGVLIWGIAMDILVRMPLVLVLFGIDFSTVRYQILCGATVAGGAYSASRFLSGQKAVDIFFALAQAAIILLSVTRTEILTVGAMVTTLFLSAAKRLLDPKRIAIGIGMIVLAVLAVYTLDAVLPESPIARWSERTAAIEAGQQDFSGLDRLSQALFQIQKLSDAGIEKLIGFGMAAPGGNDPYYVAYAYARTHSLPYTPKGFADETYITIFFLAGFLGAGPLFLAQFVWLWQSIKAIRYVLRRYPARFSWLTMAPVAVIGYQVANILASTFGDRTGSVFFGLCLGFTGWLTALRRNDVREGIRAAGQETASLGGSVAQPL